MTTALDVWPMPAEVELGASSASISPALDMQLHLRGAARDEEERARRIFERYRALSFPHKSSCPCQGEVRQALVSVRGVEGEAYELRLNASTLEVDASSIAGLQYALETLSQLVSFDVDQLLYFTQPVLPLKVRDRPRFSHRGLLVDSSRHFLPVQALKRVIDSMAYTKLNVLHWHVIDSESFPLTSRVAPELSQLGAYSSRERYTQADVAELVDYAKERSIMIVPEFDMPGHVDSWAKSHPELYVRATRGSTANGVHGALNPANEDVFKLVKNLLADWLVGNTSSPAFFDSPIVHLGGDEVPEQAWSTAEIRSFLASEHMHGARDLFAKFIARNADVAQHLGKRVVLWDEALERTAQGALPATVMIQVWRDWAGLKLGLQAVNQGHQVIASPSGKWYLDHLDTSWQDMYNVDPVEYLKIPSNKENLVIGGEGCMWGETVDGGDLEVTLWPRLAAIAERLWSPMYKTTSTEAALPRLKSFRCLLLERGISSSSPTSGIGRQRRYAPEGPGSCWQPTKESSFLQRLVVNSATWKPTALLRREPTAADHSQEASVVKSTCACST